MRRAPEMLFLLTALAVGAFAFYTGVLLLPEWMQGIAKIVFGFTAVCWSLDRMFVGKQ